MSEADPNAELAKLLAANNEREQSIEGAIEVAAVVASFYCTLKDTGVDEDGCINLTLAWMERAFE